MTATLSTCRDPAAGEPRTSRSCPAHETTLPNGLRLVVVPRAGVPLIELRLRVPFAARTAARPP